MELAPWKEARSAIGHVVFGTYLAQPPQQPRRLKKQLSTIPCKATERGLLIDPHTRVSAPMRCPRSSLTPDGPNVLGGGRSPGPRRGSRTNEVTRQSPDFIYLAISTQIYLQESSVEVWGMWFARLLLLDWWPLQPLPPSWGIPLEWSQPPAGTFGRGRLRTRIVKHDVWQRDLFTEW